MPLTQVAFRVQEGGGGGGGGGGATHYMEVTTYAAPFRPPFFPGLCKIV